MDKLVRGVPCTVRKADTKNRIVEFVISTESKDAHGTIIPVSAWNLERYNKNGVVLYQHSMHTDNVDDVVGKGKVYIEGKQLIGVVEFEPKGLNELADKVLKKIEFGSLSATSVGFIAHKSHWGGATEDVDTLYFDEVELLEFSIVKVPSNGDAVKRFVEQTPKRKLDKYELRYLEIVNSIKE